MEAAEELYGTHLTCRWGSKQLEAAVEDLAPYYTKPEIERVTRVLREQKRRYDAYFKKRNIETGTLSTKRVKVSRLFVS